ncbi:DUF550 domain-containing protein [Citrobacter freundii]|nr:DUF550 domain-containing protein [Citrobacter freundii]MDN4196847.1 DUF550 domain-containing protein [Citrobacter freundii]MDN4227322.1 DUF550 domain-containing protein [Citrobacter freundii]
MTLTKSWLQKQITDLEATRDEIPFGLDEDGNNTLAALKMALAVMKAEPVFKINHDSSLIKHVKKVVRETSAPQPLTTSEREELENYRNAQQVVRSITQHFDDIALETAIEIMCDVNRRNEFLGGEVQLLSRIQCRIDEACRTAMLQAGNSPVIPDGWALVPKRLTAENGAKSVLSGEFSETKFINCPECFGDDDCETCDGSGRIEITVPVTWTTIKAIWAKGVEHFAAAPQQEVKRG